MKIEEIVNKVHCADALIFLKEMLSESIDLCITSPPYYGLRNYGIDGQIGLEKTFDEYLKKILEITAEIKRVLKKTGTFFLNMGDCYGGSPAGNKSISEANIGSDGLYVRKMKQCAGAKSPARLTYWGGNVEKSTLTNPERQQLMGRSGNQKCMLMQPERLAIKMIDEQGWILRNKIKWCKQVLLYKERRTKGSVMPTSVKDRFNESGEELYFFVKSKKYYSDLDSVRLPVQTFEDREMGIVRQLDYPESKYNKFNYRVRDAKRKAGQPQFKASEEEIKRYNEIPKDYGKKKLQNLPDKGKGLNRWMSGTPNYTYSPRARTQRYAKGSEYEQKYGEPWDRFGQKTKKAGNKINDPRGNHEGGPGSWRDFKDNPENSFPKFQERKRKNPEELKKMGVPATYIGATGEDHNLLNNPAGKNIPTVWLIGSEPHNFQKEYGSEVDHFATFPEALCEIPIKFGCPPGGIVLDCFAGAGTALVVAKKLKRNYIGIELNEKYVKISQERIRRIPTPLF